MPAFEDLPGATRRLLPTPRTTDGNGAGLHGDGGADLRTTVTMEGKWGIYAPAIHRQERLSRPAPSPTEPNTKGDPRLAAPFPEWMMFLPEGHVTNPAINLSRNEQLKAIGNGVCPPQAVAAYSSLLRMRTDLLTAVS
ncbi:MULTISPECIES: hypothetical protein [unclassified Rhodococcus (in: high G+C Gram-positive bacteria)]|uniref:hypothetical protein n=1 Tax=unclassified Rhodococcus (in: high G+C Gram-positive bacteria) TaxID=192944 RepID=UPI0020CD225D|nr:MULTISPECIES: hypothetical protein [unclassified Rhodococcus (in: high G+C Gram-positive bacteria)]